MVDAAHEKEAKSKESSHRLKTEIEQLSKLVEQGAGLTMGQEHRYGLDIDDMILGFWVNSC